MAAVAGKAGASARGSSRLMARTSGTKEARKATKPAKRRRGAARRTKKAPPTPEPKPLAYIPTSYNGALVYDIATGNADKKVTEEALLLDHMMLNLTESSSKAAYRSGLSIGTTLYDIARSVRFGSQYEDYVPYIVEFLERAGYYVTYGIFPDKAIFRLHGHSLYIGARMHTLEAGIISGFISAARHSYTPVDETSCRNDRAEACVFETSQKAASSSVRRDMLDRFVGHVHGRASSGAYVDASFSQSYHALLSSSVLEQAHMETLRGIMHYIGSSLRKRLESNAMKPTTSSYIANSITLLRLGTPYMDNMRRLDIRLAFDTATSRSGMAELSIAFLNGILGERAGRAIATESNNNGSYTIRLASPSSMGSRRRKA